MTKTTRVMLAVLAVCSTSAAMAQSSVTLYGRVNTSVEHQKLGNTSVSGMVSNSSYIGFKGVEDLGNGLKAGFILESSFQSDSGSGPMNFSRNSEVNLSGNFGTLRAGSFDPASMLVTTDFVSMHNHNTGTSADYLADNYISTGNQLAYVTPNLGGFTAEVQYKFGEKAQTISHMFETTSEDKGGWDLGLNYANGPLGLGFGYSTYKTKSLEDNSNEKISQYALRASYTIGSLTLAGYYQRQDDKYGEPSFSFKTKRNVYRLAAMYVFGASELHANYGKASKVKVSGLEGAEGAKSANQWTLAYNYNLSKRTKVYALYTTTNRTESAGIPAPFIGGSNTGSDKFRAIGVGVRHLF